MPPKINNLRLPWRFDSQVPMQKKLLPIIINPVSKQLDRSKPVKFSIINMKVQNEPD